jgi:hypothetical protein
MTVPPFRICLGLQNMPPIRRYEVVSRQFFEAIGADQLAQPRRGSMIDDLNPLLVGVF